MEARARLRNRDSREVLEDHIRLRERGELERDLERNYDPQVLILTGRHVFKGHDGVRDAARLLAEAVAPDSYRFRALVIGDRMGYCEWTATGDEAVIRDGVDSYLVEGGMIRAQTIHYTAISSSLSTAGMRDGQPGLEVTRGRE